MKLQALLTQKQVADLIGVSRKTIERWRYEGAGPAWLRVGQGVRYHPADVTAWLELHRNGGDRGREAQTNGALVT